MRVITHGSIFPTTTRAGRRVEISNARGIVEVVEITRTGEPVRTARFMASRVLALVEHPASEAARAGAREDAGGAPKPRGLF